MAGWRERESMTRSPSLRRPLEARGLLVGTAALLAVAFTLAGCSGTSELALKNERLREALDRSVSQLEKERASVRDSLARTEDLEKQLKQESERSVGLEAQIEKLEADKAAIGKRAVAIQRDFLRLKETHERLGKMAQESLAELSGLRQRQDSLANERKTFEQQLAVRTKQVAELTAEADALRVELRKTRDAIRIMQENGDTTLSGAEVTRIVNENKRLQEVANAQKDQIVALSEEVVGLRADLARSLQGDVASIDSVPEPGTVWADTRELFGRRWENALNGEMKWDAFDVTVVSLVGFFIVLALTWLWFIVRHVRLRWRLHYLERYVDEVVFDEAASEEEAEYVEPVSVSPPVRRNPPRKKPEAPPRRPPPRSMAALEREEELVGSRTQRISPHEFSPIMRSSHSDAEDEQQSDDPDESPFEAEDDGAQTQIISDIDLSSLGDAPLEPPAVQVAKAEKAVQEKKSSGTGEEKELLDELKTIINKKFEGPGGK